MQKGDYRFPLPVVRTAQAIMSASVVLFIIALFYALSIPGRIDSARFNLGLRRGLTHGQVDSLEKQTSGHAYVTYNADKNGIDIDSLTPSGHDRLKSVAFTTTDFICSSTSDVYLLSFSDEDLLQSWTKSEVGDAC